MATLAPSLVRLRDEINSKFPARDKSSDGWIGDPAHASRYSDHNPDAQGWVHALDVDIDDGDPGLDLRVELIRAAEANPATAYWISNGMIWSEAKGLRKYDGENGHFAHVHISIFRTPAARTSTARWLQPRVVIKVRTKIQEGRAKLRQARREYRKASKNGRPAAARAVRRITKTLKTTPKE